MRFDDTTYNGHGNLLCLEGTFRTVHRLVVIIYFGMRSIFSFVELPL